MANLYVWSGGSNTAPYDTWAKAAVLLATAAGAAAAGDDIWVASVHAESSAAAQTITFPGTSASPNRCISVNKAGSTPPVAADILAGAAVTTTGANAITIGGCVYGSGIAFNCGTGSVAASITLINTSSAFQIFDNCALNLLTTAAGSRININNNSCLARWTNTTVSFGSTSQGIAFASGSWMWDNKPGSVAVTGATIPTTMVVASSSNLGFARWSGLDLSAAGSGKTLIGAHSAKFTVVNCKLGSSVTVAATPTISAAGGIFLIGCSDTTNVERNEIYNYPGTLTTETTIKRTAGSSDGTTAYSWKAVTTANAKRTFPFETFEGAVWNSTTGSSKTLTFHCVTDNVTLQDADIWVEVEYLGSSATPVTTLISSAPATQLTTGANLTTDTEAWTTTGLVTPVKQKFSVTFTPQMAGPIRWKVKVAKATATVYVDAYPDLA